MKAEVWEDINKVKHRITYVQNDIKNEKKRHSDEEQKQISKLTMALDELFRLVEDLDNESDA